jgi:hypothetical protein
MENLLELRAANHTGLVSRIDWTYRVPTSFRRLYNHELGGNRLVPVDALTFYVKSGLAIYPVRDSNHGSYHGRADRGRISSGDRKIAVTVVTTSFDSADKSRDFRNNVAAISFFSSHERFR